MNPTSPTWDCTEARPSLGVYVLGAIDPADVRFSMSIRPRETQRGDKPRPPVRRVTRSFVHQSHCLREIFLGASPTGG